MYSLLKREIGISSRGQDELVAARMVRFISSDKAGAKKPSEGGTAVGAMCTDFRI